MMARRCVVWIERDAQPLHKTDTKAGRDLRYVWRLTAEAVE
jgi:hypothetical protein